MYHCRVVFYLIGHERTLWETIQALPPLPQFSHEFMESRVPDPDLAAQADVILADLTELPAEATVRELLRAKKADAEVILLAAPEQMKELTGSLSRLKDVWPLPMSEAELGFRFLRWQGGFQLGKELWQARSYLDAAIDNSPNLIWFKDRDGIHRKVNNSFCRTVNKTKEQVEGRGHAYIWDVEEDDPACIESERIVMETQKTCVSEETVRTGEGPRLLTTYKSPLYDFDGSVVGTVGVAIDITQERAYKEEIIMTM